MNKIKNPKKNSKKIFLRVSFNNLKALYYALLLCLKIILNKALKKYLISVLYGFFVFSSKYSLSDCRTLITLPERFNETYGGIQPGFCVSRNFCISFGMS